MAREPFSGHLEMLLLAAVQTRSMHGYAIIEHVREASSGRFEYAEGTIYPALRHLEIERLVASRWHQVEGRRRRVYTITAKGSRELSARRGSWERFTRSVQAVLDHG
jgi:PadR family transcriptional regulator, regulatory protein PadR